MAAMPHDGRRRGRGGAISRPCRLCRWAPRYRGAGAHRRAYSPQIRRPRQTCGQPRRLPLPNGRPPVSSGSSRVPVAISPDTGSVGGKVVPLAPQARPPPSPNFCTVGKPCGGRCIGRLARLCDGQRHLACAQRASAAQRHRSASRIVRPGTNFLRDLGEGHADVTVASLAARSSRVGSRSYGC